MTDIYDLVQDSEFGSSSNRAVQVETSLFAMRSSRLLGILQRCFDSLESDVMMVCSDIISTASAVDLADNNLQTSYNDDDQWRALDNRTLRDKFTIVFDGYRKMFDQYRKMFDQSLSNSKILVTCSGSYLML